MIYQASKPVVGTQKDLKLILRQKSESYFQKKKKLSWRSKFFSCESSMFDEMIMLCRSIKHIAVYKLVFRENWGLYDIFLVPECKEVGHGSSERWKYLKEEKN